MMASSSLKAVRVFKVCVSTQCHSPEEYTLAWCKRGLQEPGTSGSLFSKAVLTHLCIFFLGMLAGTLSNAQQLHLALCSETTHGSAQGEHID